MRDETVVREVTAVKREEKTVVVSVGVKSGDKEFPREEVAVAEGGLYRRRFRADDVFMPEVCLLSLPVRPGAAWTSRFTFRGFKYTLTRTARKPEPVEVPAGRYEAVRVDIEDTKEDRIAGREWYAQGVGVVRAEWDAPTKEELILTKFEPGKE